MYNGTGRRLLTALGVAGLLVATCGPTTSPLPSPTQVGLATPTLTAVPPTGVAAAPAVPTATAAPAPTAAAVAAGPKYGGTLRIRTVQQLVTWDPGRDWTLVGEASLWMYPRLFSYYRGKPGEPPCNIYPIQPELATGFKWVDDTTLDVTIRQGIKLPQKPPLNGREADAEDVAFTFNRIFFGSRLSPVQPMAAITESVSATDRYTVRFKLKSPHAEYPQVALSFFDTPVMPPETLTPPGDPKGEYTLDGHRLGAYGRFRPTNWAPAVSIDMERNQDFFVKGLPYLDGVSIKSIPEESTFLAALRAGRMDSGYTRSSDTIDDLKRMADLSYVACPATQSAPAFMNMNRPEFQDVNVRRAISMAIDREALNKLVYHGLAKGAYSFSTPALGRQWYMEPEDYPPEVRRWVTYDVKGAKDLLAKTAYAGGLSTKILFWPGQSGMGQTAEALSGMLGEIGIKLRLETLTNAEYQAVVGGYPWDKPDTRHTGFLMGLASWTAVDDIYQYAYSKSNRNRSVIKDPRVDQMIEEQRRTLDESKRQKVLKDLQTYIVDQMYVLPLPIGPHAEVHLPSVKGIYFKTYGYYDGESMRDVWLDR